MTDNQNNSVPEEVNADAIAQAVVSSLSETLIKLFNPPGATLIDISPSTYKNIADPQRLLHCVEQGTYVILTPQRSIFDPAYPGVNIGYFNRVQMSKAPPYFIPIARFNVNYECHVGFDGWAAALVSAHNYLKTGMIT